MGHENETRVRGSVIAVMVGAKIFCQLPTRQLLVALTILPTRRLVNKIYLLVNPENLFFDFVKNPESGKWHIPPKIIVFSAYFRISSLLL